MYVFLDPPPLGGDPQNLCLVFLCSAIKFDTIFTISTYGGIDQYSHITLIYFLLYLISYSNQKLLRQPLFGTCPEEHLFPMLLKE